MTVAMVLAGAFLTITGVLFGIAIWVFWMIERRDRAVREESARWYEQRD